MFSDKSGLTEAVLSGRKTMTRQIIKLDSLEEYSASKSYGNPEWSAIEKSIIARYARYKVGEVVAVAQAYREIAHPDEFLDERYEVKDEFVSGWANKLFVRADLMPHQIHITNVRVEKLQDIGDVDCLAEGIEFSHKAQSFYVKTDYITGTQTWLGNTPREAYAALIDRISGKGTFESNPYVFVYEFELIK